MVNRQETAKLAAKAPASGGHAADMEHVGELAAYTPYQLLCLNRLGRLLELQQSDETARLELWKRKALAKVAYSVFLDCVAAGVEQEGHRLVQECTPKQAETPHAPA
ncbi:MAG: hypothetical protein EXR48_00095 [Dehalococcoidia bacterium]|nr:hypothetical protein [Dehalococcoidia bacterium]